MAMIPEGVIVSLACCKGDFFDMRLLWQKGFAALFLSCSAVCPAAEVTRRLQVEGEGGTPVTATTTLFLEDRFTGFTLADAAGNSRPCLLLNRDGSRISIHFDAHAGERLTLRPAADVPLPSPGFAHRTGLLHLVKRYDGRAVNTVAEFDALWRQATFEGGRFAEQIYAAYNPFGANSNALHRYEGGLILAKSGAITFCVASTDASFLLVNGQQVAAWPGNHPVKEGLDGSKRGTVTLAAGTHRIAFLHANSGAASFAIAAMTLPGDARHFVIGPEYFTRAAYAYVAPLVDASGARQPDFIWENAYMVALRGHAGYEVRFEATALAEPDDAAYMWDFGDGTQGNGRITNHLYFVEGDVPVTLTVSPRGGVPRVCRQILRIMPRYGQNENDDARALNLLNRAVQQEREAGIQPNGYALITLGYFFFLKEAAAAAFTERVLAALDRMPEEDLAPVLRELALGVQQVDEQYELAERCFRALLDRVKDPKARASAALHFGGMLNLCLNRPQEAREILNAIRRDDLTDWEPRLLDIYLADTALVLDDVATAQKLYAAIPRQTPLLTGTALDRKALFDYNSRHFRVQNLLSQGLFRESLPEVDMLEWEMPEERASPRINLMKVQALVGNGQPRKASVCLQRALLAEVDETYTPKLRLELAKLYLAQRQFQQARHQIALIRKESPWTHEEIEARRLLDDIERALTEVTP